MILVINNHVDLDGLLSVFVLTYPTLALHIVMSFVMRLKLEIFWAWSEGKSLKIFRNYLIVSILGKQKVDLPKKI